MNSINKLMDDYYRFIQDKTKLKVLESGWTEIQTPFTGLFNDTIDIYIKQEKGKVFLSDDGETLRNLELSGVYLSRSEKRKEFLSHIQLNYGVRLEGEELVTEGTEKEFPQKKLNLLSAISEISDLHYLADHTIASVFREDVETHLKELDLTYTPYFISKGGTGLEFTFDFQLAYKKTEIVIKSFNSVNKVNLPQFLFTWEDVKSVREKQTGKVIIGLAILNDSKTEIKQEYLEAFGKKGADFILWSGRKKPESIEKLQAA